MKQPLSWKPQLTALHPLGCRMNAGFIAFVSVHRSGEGATYPIARFSGRLAVLRFVALKDSDPLRAKARVESYALKDSFQYPLEGYSDPLRAKAPVESYAGSGHAPHRALPVSLKTAHPDASNCGFQDYVFESVYELVLKNARPEAVTVTVREPMPGDWTMVSASQAHTKAASGIAEWKVNVPAGGAATLIWRVRVRY